MRILHSLRACLLLAGVILAAESANAAAITHTAAGPQKGFAVIELFTSEGCSSCPPADEAFLRLGEEAATNREAVYILEWHVDYWDYLGWKDPIDSSLATTRQRSYARALGSSLYTPQAVFNGSTIASYAGDWRELNTLAQHFLSAAPQQGIGLALKATATGTSLRVHADVQGAQRGSILLLAIVEAGLGAMPTAGENAGQRLRHSDVVRSMTTLTAAAADVVLSLPRDADLGRSAVVGLLQDPGTMRISFAARATIRAEKGGGISGRVVDPAGHGRAGVLVQACSDRVCVPAATGVHGGFALVGLPAGSYRISLNNAQPVLTVTVSDSRTVSIGSVRGAT